MAGLVARFRASVLAAVLLTLVATGNAGASGRLAIVTGQDGGWPEVKGWTPSGLPATGSAPWGDINVDFSMYPTWQGGVRVAVGDFDGNGRNEILTAPGPNGGFTELRIFDGRTFAQTGTYLPFTSAAWWNGAFVAAGDVNGDGRDEIVDGLDTGCCTTINVVDPATGRQLSGFYPYGNNSQLGAVVAAADLDGDGKAELLAVRFGAGQSEVDVFGGTGGSPIRTLVPFGDTTAIWGVRVAAGDLFGDRRPELAAVASTSTGVEARVLDPRTGALLATYAVAPGVQATAAAQIAVADVDGNGTRDLIVLIPRSDGTQVVSLDTAGKRLGSFFVLQAGIVPGASLAAGDLDGDGKAEIVLGGGPTTAPWPPQANGPDQQVAIYHADGTPAGGFSAYPGVFQGGVRVALADVTGSGGPEVVTAPGPGTAPEVDVVSRDWVNGRDRGTRLAHFLAFEPTFTGGATVAAGDVNGDGRSEIVVGAGPGRAPEVRVFDATGRQLESFLAFEAPYIGGIDIAVGDVNGDGRADIVAATLSAPGRVRVFSGGSPFGPVSTPLPDANGLQVAVADVNGNGRGLVVAAPARGPASALALVDPATGAVIRSGAVPGAPDGLHLGSTDTDRDGREEILVSESGWNGDGVVRILNGRLQGTDSFAAYDWQIGVTVAGAASTGLPLTAYPRTVRYLRGVRTNALVAQFRDFAGARRPFVAHVNFGNGSGGRATVVRRGGGLYEVRAAVRYRARGRFPLTVTLSDGAGRLAVARGTAIVR